jgi:molybdenum cofactor cytidylyltransferase
MLTSVVACAREAGLDPLIVTGHEASKIEALLAGQTLSFTHNPDFADGLSTSLRAGCAALPDDIGAVFILLGDMPRLSAHTLRALQDAAHRDVQAQAFMPVFAGRWGNPVLIRRSLFASLSRLHGDQGARKLLEAAPEIVCEVSVDDPGILADFDTQEALKRGT